MAKQPQTSAPRAEDGVWPVASSSFRLTSMRRPCWATPTEGQDRPGCRGLRFRGHGVMESTAGCEAADPGSIPGAPSTHDTKEELQ